MTDLVTAENRIPAMSSAAKDKVRELEEFSLTLPQVDVPIHQSIHAGVYQRTAMIPAGVYITGAEIRVPTLLIVAGHCKVFTGEDVRELVGYNVLHAEAGRKQAFVAIQDTTITMAFATKATTVEAAEEEFTDEVDILTTRKSRLPSSQGD